MQYALLRDAKRSLLWSAISLHCAIGDWIFGRGVSDFLLLFPVCVASKETQSTHHRNLFCDDGCAFALDRGGHDGGDWTFGSEAVLLSSSKRYAVGASLDVAALLSSCIGRVDFANSHLDRVCACGQVVERFDPFFFWSDVFLLKT